MIDIASRRCTLPPLVECQYGFSICAFVLDVAAQEWVVLQPQTAVFCQFGAKPRSCGAYDLDPIAYIVEYEADAAGARRLWMRRSVWMYRLSRYCMAGASLRILATCSPELMSWRMFLSSFSGRD